MTLLMPQGEGIPCPRPSDLTAEFWSGCAQHRLRYQRCSQCDTPVFNPAPICPTCRSTELLWHDSAGRGTIYSWTVAYRPLSPRFSVPYAPVIVDLDEGYLMVSNLIGCTVPEIAIGIAVQVDFHRVGKIVMPYFRPL